MNPVATAALVVTSIGSISGTALYLNQAHVATEDFRQHLSEQRVRTIFSYMDQINEHGPQPWLCRAMREEFAQLCTELPEHAMCDNDSDKMILREVGCL